MAGIKKLAESRTVFFNLMKPAEPEIHIAPGIFVARYGMSARFLHGADKSLGWNMELGKILCRQGVRFQLLAVKVREHLTIA